MKVTLQWIALLLILTILAMNCLVISASGIEMRDQVEAAENRNGDDLPETGDLFFTRLKAAGLTVIASACILILLNSRKRI